MTFCATRAGLTTEPLILRIESPKNGWFYGHFCKPVDFGAQTVTDRLAHFHRIAQKQAILWKCFPWHITYLRNFGFHRIAQIWAILWKLKFHNTNNTVIGRRIAQKWVILCSGTKGLRRAQNWRPLAIFCEAKMCLGWRNVLSINKNCIL
jgi:hypothetical protein